MVLFISRAPAFSPNNVEKDARILALTARCCEEAGHDVSVIDEDTFASGRWLGQRPEYVFSMGRRLSTLIRLEQLGRPCVNGPRAVRNTALSRELTMMLLQFNGIPVPEWWAYEPTEDEMFQCEPRLRNLLPGWIKVMRPDGVKACDVEYVETPVEADTAVIKRVAEGVTDLVCTRHLEGDLLKVYAVADGDILTFFQYFSPPKEHYTKFGNESRNAYSGYRPDKTVLQQLALSVSRACGLQVFGIDVILGADGSATVIDVNDWPSFSRFQDEAARAIAALL